MANTLFENDDSRSLGVHRPASVPMPRVDAPEKMVALRKLKQKRSVNDLVEELFIKMAPNDTFVSYLDAVGDEQAIEGSLSADTYKASEMIREQAREDHSEVGNLKLATIGKSLNVVLKRYGFGRKQRRYTVGGEFVPADDGNSNNAADTSSA